MVAAFSLLLIFAVSFVVTRIASVALRITGLEEQDARFHALSALTGTGFTTSNAELIVNYPIRRKIISGLMLFGNLGVISVLSTTMISFVHVGSDLKDIVVQLAWIAGSIVFFLCVMLHPVVDRMMCGMIAFLLNKFTFLGGRHYRKILQLGNGLSIGEHQFFSRESLAGESLTQILNDLSVIAIHRSGGEVEVFNSAIEEISWGDKIVLLGLDAAHERFAGQAAHFIGIKTGGQS